MVNKISGQNAVLKQMVEKFDFKTAGLKKSVEQISTQNTGLKQMVEKVAGQNRGLKNMVDNVGSENRGLKQMVEKFGKQNTGLTKMVENFGSENAGLKKSVDGLKGVVDGMNLSVETKNAEVQKGIEDAFAKWGTHIVDKVGDQNTGLKKMVEKFDSENVGLKKSVEDLKGVVDEMKMSAETKNAEVQKAIGGFKDVAEGMKENLSNMEKVESSRSFKFSQPGIALISFHQGIRSYVRGSLAKWSKHLVDKVGSQNKGLTELKGVVQNMKLESTGIQEQFGPTIEKLMKAVDEMKEKSSNMEKVSFFVIPFLPSLPFISDG